MTRPQRDVIAKGPDREPRRPGRRSPRWWPGWWPGWWPVWALGLAVAVTVALWPGRDGAGPPAPLPPSPSPSAPAPQARDAVVARIPLGIGEFGEHADIALGEGAVWVADWGGRRLLKVSPAGNRIVAERRLDGRIFGGAARMAYGAGTVWIAMEPEGTVARIDPRTLHITARVEYGGGYAPLMAFGAGRLWIMTCCGLGDERPTLARIDPRTNQVDRAPLSGGGAASLLLAGPGSVWTDTAFPLLTRLDPDTMKVVDEVWGGRSGGPAVVGRGAAWTVSGDSRLVRIEELHAEWTLGPEGSGQGVEAIGAGPDGVFVATHDGRLMQIDERTLRAVRGGVVVNPPLPQSSQLLSAGPDGVWLATRGELVRIDPDRLPLTSDP
jgi:hypothetical protein